MANGFRLPPEVPTGSSKGCRNTAIETLEKAKRMLEKEKTELVRVDEKTWKYVKITNKKEEE